MTFKVGDRVKYTSGRHGNRQLNPVWGESEGYVVGTINNHNPDGWWNVAWDNGHENTYQEIDIELINTIFPHNSILFETK